MENITDVSVISLTESRYLHPMRLSYKQAGSPRLWDLMRCHDSVAIVIFNTETKKFIFVQQFRPAVYLSQVAPAVTVGDEVDTDKFPGHLGLTVELCAGIVDKELSLEEIARQEVREECGYLLPHGRLTKIVTFPSSVGSSGEEALISRQNCPPSVGGTQTLFCAEVVSSDRVGEGGGLEEEGEMIRVVEMSVEEVQVLLTSDTVNSPAGLLYGVNWYLQNRLGRLSAQQ